MTSKQIKRKTDNLEDSIINEPKTKVAKIDKNETEVKPKQDVKIVLNTFIVSTLMNSIRFELENYGGGMLIQFHEESPNFEVFIKSLFDQDLTNKDYICHMEEDKKITGHCETMIKCIIHQFRSYLPNQRVENICLMAICGSIDELPTDAEITKTLMKLHVEILALEKHLNEYLFTKRNRIDYKKYLDTALENKSKSRTLFKEKHIKHMSAIKNKIENDMNLIAHSIKLIDEYKKSH